MDTTWAEVCKETLLEVLKEEQEKWIKNVQEQKKEKLELEKSLREKGWELNK